MKKNYTHPSILFWILFAGVAVAALFLVVWKGIFSLVLLGSLFAIWLLSYHLTFGWYVLVFLSPMIHWFFRFDTYWYLFQDYPQLLDIYAPVVEFWALGLTIAWIVSLARDWFQGKKVTIFAPGLPWFLLFLASAVISLISLSAADLGEGMKFIVRVLLLWYVGYVVLGANIVTNKKILHTSLYLLACTGLLGALMGFASFFNGAWQIYGFPRSTPFAIFGIAPFGTQHIFLAEVITTTLPLWLYFWYTQKDQQKQIWLAFASIFIFSIGLFTLSRAAWVTLFFEVLIFLFLMRKRIDWQRYSSAVMWGIFLLFPLFSYLLYFLLTSYAAGSSTAARVALTEIAWQFFLNHPIVGNGVGSFIPLLSDVYAFAVDFGDPIDAHGLGQKLLAEQGILGLLTFSLFIGWIVYHVFSRYFKKSYTHEARLMSFVFFFLVLSPLIFQLFNTQYYSSKMWIPIAIAGTIVYGKETWSPSFILRLPHVKKKHQVSMRID